MNEKTILMLPVITMSGIGTVIGCTEVCEGIKKHKQETTKTKIMPWIRETAPTVAYSAMMVSNAYVFANALAKVMDQQ